MSLHLRSRRTELIDRTTSKVDAFLANEAKGELIPSRARA
jgi:hypothetical protein